MVMASGLFGLTFRDALDTSNEPVDFLLDSFKIELVTNTYTPDFDVHDQEADITNEIVDATDIPAGGIALGTLTFAIVATHRLTFDAANPQWTNADATGIRGRVVYDDTPTTPVSDPLVVATTFGQDYTVTAGSLTINEDTAGLFYITFA